MDTIVGKMRKSISKLPIALAVLALAMLAGRRAEAFSANDAAASLVRIHVTAQREDFATPWQGGRPSSHTGTGFIIAGKRILTNAHIVSDARFIQIQKDGDSRRYRATLAHVADDCDLATLAVDDERFFEHTRPLRLASRLPRLNDEVIALGYPLGGNRLSVTRGVVSRIDYATYSHSGVDDHLVLQVDAAINPGNSGGPVLQGGRVVGVAFQGIAWAENIGYAIPLPVIERFLADIEDDTYHGYPELGTACIDLENPALRKSLGLPDDRSGVAIYYLDPFGSGHNLLHNRDVLLTVDGRPIANDGTVALDEGRVLFAEFLERKQRGDTVSFDVWRERQVMKIEIPLVTPDDPFVYRNLYNQRPRYLIRAGLVFSPLTRAYVRTLNPSSAEDGMLHLVYALQYAKLDGLYKNRDELVVLIHRLPHPVNTYLENFVNGIVAEVNGRPVRGLVDMRDALRFPQEGYHVIRFLDMEPSLILEADAVDGADAHIARSYGIGSMENLDNEPTHDAKEVHP